MTKLYVDIMEYRFFRVMNTISEKEQSPEKLLLLVPSVTELSRTN